jgi:O-antigen/teichoic acid export membrane protein
VRQRLGLPGYLPVYLAVVCACEIVYQIYHQVLVSHKESRKDAALNLTKAYANIALAVILVLMCREERYLGQVWAMVAVNVVMAGYVIRRMLPSVTFVFKKEYVQYIARYSLPLLPYVLGGPILAQFDRIVINNISGPSAAGVYSLGYSIGMLLVMVISAMQSAVLPEFFALQHSGDHARLDRLTGRIFSLTALCALGLMYFAREIVMALAPHKFYGSIAVICPVVIGYVFYAMFAVYGRFVGWKNNIHAGYSSLVSLCCGALNIWLNLVYVPRYGYIAAAYTTAVSYFFYFLLEWIVAKFVVKERITPLSVVWGPTLWMFLFLGAVYCLGLYVSDQVVMFCVKVLMLAAYGMTVFRADADIFFKKLRTQAG